MLLQQMKPVEIKLALMKPFSHVSDGDVEFECNPSAEIFGLMLAALNKDEGDFSLLYDRSPKVANLWTSKHVELLVDLCASESNDKILKYIAHSKTTHNIFETALPENKISMVKKFISLSTQYPDLENILVAQPYCLHTSFEEEARPEIRGKALGELSAHLDSLMSQNVGFVDYLLKQYKDTATGECKDILEKMELFYS